MIMRSFSLILLTGAAFQSLLVLPLRVEAHELLPNALVEYMQQHPDASPAEIEAYLEADPNLYPGDKVYRARLLESVRGPKQGFFHTMIDFIRLGLHHIFSGVDHILFILSLLLAYVSLRKTIKLVTYFTLAHSVSLILAGTGVLVLSSRIVEPAIALSIAYVAITTVFLRHIPFFRSDSNKSSTVFFFGLFHGLGFAGLLTDLNVPKDGFLASLLAFNLGIEIGQICIILLALPLLWYARRYSWYETSIRVVAVLIAAIALYWMIERIIG